MLEDHKLGVVFAIAPRLFREARNEFHICNDAFKYSDTAGNEDREQMRRQLLLCTRVLLLLNGDFYTAWNTRYARSSRIDSGFRPLTDQTDCRKAFVAKEWLDAAEEIQFCDLVFTVHPKSIDTWAYRCVMRLSGYPVHLGLTSNAFDCLF